MARIFFAVLLAFAAGPSNAAEDCSPKSLGVDLDEAHPQRLYYVGTCHYRNEDYARAAAQWRRLVALETVEDPYYRLQVFALGNLAFLSFYGYGVPVDKPFALESWHRAASLGGIEAEYQLCSAYGDPDKSTYAPARGLAHCIKADLLYSGMEERDDVEERILGDIRRYREALPAL